MPARRLSKPTILAGYEGRIGGVVEALKRFLEQMR
jgi:hypothetical protein